MLSRSNRGVRIRHGSSRRPKWSDNSESTVTVWVALLADLGVAIAKLAAGVATGSSSMLAESAHSLADGSSQALLLVGIRTSRRGADRTHPFGHGMARYLWTLWSRC
jgi:divalent metal cation (Fe/Co/Zn/Cd) transporter